MFPGESAGDNEGKQRINMAKYSRLRVLNTMIETGLVPVFYNPDVEVASKIVEALAESGVRCFEFVNLGDQAHLVFGELVHRFGDDNQVILGAGSVVDPVTAGQYIQLGANFIVGPVLNPDVAKICNRRKVAYSPGCGSPSEISAAEELGVEIVKIFPGSQIGGPGFVKAIRGPMPWTYLMPTGGVAPTEDNLRGWFEAGVACVGMGSKLVRKDLVAAGDFNAIRDAAAETLEIIRNIRSEYPIFY
jgi:2-dehydro-3-deoxyphosphogluconate aldolase/(4S)-4-hydroxy-2-oxoglutarate aldolase